MDVGAGPNTTNPNRSMYSCENASSVILIIMEQFVQGCPENQKELGASNLIDAVCNLLYLPDSLKNEHIISIKVRMTDCGMLC